MRDGGIRQTPNGSEKLTFVFRKGNDCPGSPRLEDVAVFKWGQSRANDDLSGTDGFPGVCTCSAEFRKQLGVPKHVTGGQPSEPGDSLLAPGRGPSSL